MCVCVRSGLVFFFFLFRSFARTLSSVFRPLFTHSHQSRIWCVIPFCNHPSLLCSALAMFCRRWKNKIVRTHTSPTRTSVCWPEYVCVCVCPYRTSFQRVLVYVMNSRWYFYFRFCRIFGQTASGRTWIEIDDSVFANRKKENHWIVHLEICDGVAMRPPKLIRCISFEWISGFNLNIIKEVPLGVYRHCSVSPHKITWARDFYET